MVKGATGPLWSRGEVCVAGRDPSALGLWGRRQSDDAGKAFRVYLESKVRSNQGTGMCFKSNPERTQKKKSLNINIQHNYYSLC